MEDVVWREPTRTGKMDLVVDLNFRMDTSALYSDIVLPSASWYEKDDLNTTDLHSYIHPLGAAVPPCWESKTDWDIFKALSRRKSANSARHTFPSPFRDLVTTPLLHDTPDEIAQPRSARTGIQVSASRSPARPCRTSRWSSATTRICTTSSALWARG